MLCFFKVLVGMAANVATTSNMTADQAYPQILWRKIQWGTKKKKVKSKKQEDQVIIFYYTTVGEWYSLPPALHIQSICSLQLVLVFDSTYIQDTWKQHTFGFVTNMQLSFVNQENACKEQDKNNTWHKTTKPGEISSGVNIRWMHLNYITETITHDWLKAGR